MCVVIVTFIHVMSERIPNLEDDSDYSRWKKAVKVWQLGTTAKKTQQASRLIGFMNGRAYEAALQIAPAELGDETGVDKLITELDSLFLKDATHNLFMAIEDFEHYKRPEGVAMDLYVRDFEQKRKKIDQLRGQEVYEDGVLAYKLLNQANLNPDQKRLVKATITKLDYKMMVQSLKQTFGDEVPFESPTRIETVIKEERTSCLQTKEVDTAAVPVEKLHQVKMRVFFTIAEVSGGKESSESMVMAMITKQSKPTKTTRVVIFAKIQTIV